MHASAFCIWHRLDAERVLAMMVMTVVIMILECLLFAGLCHQRLTQTLEGRMSIHVFTQGGEEVRA